MKKLPIALLFLALLANLSATRAQAAEAVPGEGGCSAAVTQGESVTIFNEGQGPDVILIPGLSTPRAVWEPTAARLKATYRLHIVQVRGFGDAAGPNAEGAVLPRVTADVRGFIADCIVGQGRPAPDIIGHSMGGLTGLMVAAEAPDRVGRLMIVDALPFIETLFGAASVDAVRPQAEAMAASLRSTYGKAPLPPAVFTDEQKKARARESLMAADVASLEKIGAWSKASDVRVVAQLAYDVMTTDMRGELGTVTAPVTLIYAQDDNVLPAAKVKAMFEPSYAGLPHFKAQMIPGSRHFIMLDQPDAFAAAVDAFLAG